MTKSGPHRKDTDLMAEKALREIGICEGQTILDFGCGPGYYAIPAGEIVGDVGVVYALDKNGGKLKELRKRIRKRKLSNIEIVKSSEDPNIELEDHSIDVTLLFDIFWYFSLTDPRLYELLREVRRVSMTGSLLSVYPKHTNSGKLKEKIEGTGFKFRDQYSGTLLHQGQPEEGRLLNFEVRPA